MKYLYIFIILFLLFISYKLCDIIPPHETYGIRRYFCSNPIITIILFILCILFLIKTKII
jgi:hypothetical protein